MSDESQVKLAIVIPLFNQLPHTQAMLASLRATLPQGLAHEIVLVDDGSTDGTRPWLATLAGLPGIRTVLNPINLGFAGACNAGAAACESELLAFLNNDLLLTPGWLPPMWQALHQPGLKAGVVGNVQHRIGGGALDHAGVWLTPAGQFQHVQQLADGSPVFQRALAVTGACMLMRRADFEAVGGFDTRYRNGCEDYDLCFKLQERGLTAVVATGSRIGHHVSASRGGPSTQDERNSRTLFLRWRPEIKRELARVWLGQLGGHGAGGASHALPPWLPGRLVGGLMDTPHAAARALAEAALQRQEHRWALALDDVDQNAALPTQARTRGLAWQPAAQAWALEGEATFMFAGLRSVCDFHLCGRLAEGMAHQNLETTLCANGAHEQSFVLGPQRDFNVGLLSPLVLPTLATNHFTARVTRADPTTPPADRPAVHGAVWVTHLVVDGKEVGVVPASPQRIDGQLGPGPTV